MKTVCAWCLQLITVPDTFDEKKEKAVCKGTACHAAELLFTQMYSDKEINRRTHYAELTKGEDYDST